ncbi:DUF2510 domain-containing protein [Rhodococcus sp. YH1]|uniref:DUF2510 domain-containing protein n=1 Tax=Rhodococcus sp. YH1 TaxID=89066 RepID=UPI001386FD23|nr:hypothetical protein [Rhodococcus sp. YH1]
MITTVNESFDDPGLQLQVPLEYAQNPHILKWWNREHDDVVRRVIAEHAWYYPWEVLDALTSVIPSATIEKWAAEDPVCSEYKWYGVLMYFAIARARSTGMEDELPEPQVRSCLRCGARFREDGLVGWPYRRLGRPNLKYCRKCCEECFFENDLNDDAYSDADIVDYIVELTNILEAVPPQNIFDQPLGLAGLDDNARTAALELGARRPSIVKVKAAFGSWLHALVAAGVLPDGTQHTSRGIRSIAVDGHACYSLGEKIIDDWLTSYGIVHTKEPGYPDSNYRADFQVGDAFIEFFGLVGNADYDAKIHTKRSLAQQHGIRLIEIYPKDVTAWLKTQHKVAEQLGVDLSARTRKAPEFRPLVAPSTTKPPSPEGPRAPAAQPGWYTDPTGREKERFWDGRYWGTVVRDGTGYVYSDTPGNGTTPPNRGSDLDGKPSWEHPLQGRESEQTIQFLFRYMDSVENLARVDAETSGIGFIAPAPYWTACQRFRSARNRPAELAVLDRFAEQPHGAGALPPKLLKRRGELRAAGYHYNPIEAGMIGDYPPPESTQ